MDIVIDYEKKPFGDIAIDESFIYNKKRYVRCPTVNEGCCSPKFNAINLDDPDDLLFLNNYAEIERLS